MTVCVRNEADGLRAFRARRIRAAALWYESHAAGLGQRFVASVDEMVVRIGTAPREFPVWEADRRFKRAIVQLFPYVIFFRDFSDGIQVVAVAHAAREPGYWLKRK